MELTCYVDVTDVSIGELLDCILGVGGEEAVILEVKARQCIIQEVRDLACHLGERERDKDTSCMYVGSIPGNKTRAYLSEVDCVLYGLADVAGRQQVAQIERSVQCHIITTVPVATVHTQV